MIFQCVAPVSSIRLTSDDHEHAEIDEVLDMVRKAPFRGERIIPVLIWGSRGVGKTTRIAAYCEAHGLQMRKFQPAHSNTPADIVGRPVVSPESGEVIYALPGFLPKEDDPPGVLFIDEINRAKQEVLNSLMELIGEGTIALSGWTLPKGWQVVAAANPADVGHDVFDIDDAMVDRFLHFAPPFDASEWGAWAADAGLEPSVVDFALSDPKNNVVFGEVGFPVEIEGRLQSSPRSLEYLAALTSQPLSPRLLRVAAIGLLGRTHGERYLAWRERWEQGYRPDTLDDVLSGKTTNERLPRWLAEHAFDLIEATNYRIIAGLRNRPYDQRAAAQIGRYLAALPGDISDSFLRQVGQSASRWQEPLTKATAAWRKRNSS